MLVIPQLQDLRVQVLMNHRNEYIDRITQLPMRMLKRLQTRDKMAQIDLRKLASVETTNTRGKQEDDKRLACP